MAKILVVDDSNLMRQLAMGYLHKFGHEVTEASDGQAALDLLRSKSFDLILLDLNLPRVSGFEICQTARKEGKSCPILITSSSQGYSPWVHQLANGFLFKPYSEAVLRSKLDALLGSENIAPIFPTSAWNSPETFLHHLRGNIGSIPGLLDFFSTKKEDKALGERTFRLVKQAVEEAIKLLDSYSEIMRPILLEKSSTSLDAYLKDIISRHAVSQLPKIALRWEMDTVDLSPVNIDTKWMERAIKEILNNAQEALEGSGGTLSIGVYSDRMHSSVYISIQDQGAAITAYAQEHCFEPFFTLKKDHHGLGLSWAEKIILAHEGAISVSSLDNAGTCVLIRLPHSQNLKAPPKKLE